MAFLLAALAQRSSSDAALVEALGAEADLDVLARGMLDKSPYRLLAAVAFNLNPLPGLVDRIVIADGIGSICV